MLAGILEGFPVKKLVLANCGIGNPTLVQIVEVLSNHKTLTSIDLSDNPFNHIGLKILTNTLKSGWSINTLYLNNHQGGIMIKQVAKIAQYVENIYLCDNRYSPVHAIVLTDTIGKWSRLKRLDLSQNGLMDEGIEYLSKFLKKNETLIKLSVAENLIGNRGIKTLARVLRCHNRTLAVLNLAGNLIKGYGLSKLGDMLKINPILQSLDVRRNPGLTEGKKELFYACLDKRKIKIKI